MFSKEAVGMKKFMAVVLVAVFAVMVAGCETMCGKKSAPEAKPAAAAAPAPAAAPTVAPAAK
jgi:hypothetical protein